jgi:hypothetical protein
MGGITMKKQDKVISEFEFLKPLVERPDLEPDPVFIQSLRKKLVKNNSKFDFNNFKKRMSLVFVSLMAIVLFSFLVYSHEFWEHSTLTPTISKEQLINPPEESSPEKEYDMEELLSTYPFYSNMHQLVLENTQSEKAAEYLVLYLEAIKREDSDKIKEYSFHNQDDFLIETLINQYKEIDYGNLFIGSIVPSQAEPSYEIQLNYGESSNEYRTVHVHVNDGVNMDIYEDIYETELSSPVNEYDMEELLSTYPFYSNMHQLILEKTKSEKAAEYLVRYLEAIRRVDSVKVKEYSFHKQDDFLIETLINQYKEINYEKLFIGSIVPSQAEPSYEIQLNYGESSNEYRTIHIHVNDGVNMDIYEEIK